jgi:hypothetical protein
MKRIDKNAQSGYVLVIMLLALMAMGGVVLAGFTHEVRQDAEQSRYDYNQRILEEAKQALLIYAFNYPTNNPGRGPGRFPCPDTNNDGLPDPSSNCINGTAIVGRFPSLDPDLNLYSDLNLRRSDASGEDLWYAVSSSYANNKPPITDIINSDSTGSITLFDQSGNMIYNGAAEGIAAVIIAPGPITKRDEDDNGTYEFTQLRGTFAQRNDPRNYLETFPGGFDNSRFNNGGNNNVDGFILGPIYDPNVSDWVVNDQLMIITTDEVNAMAQKSVLQSYQDAINKYRNNIGIDAYPWLDDYSTQITVLNDYDGDVGSRLGRLPSIFANYFAPSPAASQTITSDLEMTGVQPLTVNGFPVPIFDPGVISTNAAVSFNTSGDLIITPVANGATEVRYYWDEQAAPNGWLECLPVVTGTEQDCNQATAAPGVPDSSIVPNQLATHVVRVTYANNLVSGVPFTRQFSGGAGLDPVYQPPTATEHARVYFEYSEAFLDEIGVDFKYDNNYYLSFDDILLGNVNYQLGVIYYPELPNWALATENDWHDSIQLVYAGAYAPGNATVNCAPAPPALPGNDCITVSNSSGTINDKIAVLALAAEHNFVDDLADNFANDLADIFDPENDDNDDVFAVRVGNDMIQVIR